MDPHHLQHLQQQQQQQLLQAQLQQQQHFQSPPPPQHHHYNPNTHQPYYPPQYQHPHPQQQQQQNGYSQPIFTNFHSQPAVLQPPQLTPQVNPAAVAVLSQLSQLVQYSAAVGSQWTTPPMVGQPPYRGISEVSGELFRGYQGSFGYNGAHPSFVGVSHGQGRGGSWLLSKHRVPSTSHPPHQTHQSPVTLTPQKLESASALKTEVPNYQKPQLAQKTMVAWCEVCNASCPNLDVLKQHQSGRRHQRNLRKMEGLKNGVRTEAKLQGQQHCISNTKLKVPHQTQCEQDGEDKSTTKNIPSEPLGYENSREIGKQNKNPGQPKIAPGDVSDNVKRGKKRKKMKTPKQPVEPSKRKVVTRIVCDLCNIKCETQEVFECHISGKKHLAKYTRYNGHEPMHRRVGLQVLYPPNPGAKTIFHPQEGSYVPPHVYQDIPVETSSDPLFEQNPTSTGFESTTAPESNITTGPEISHEATIGTQCLNSISETTQGSNSFPQDSIL